MAQISVCSIPGCGNKVAHRGWCSAHYQRWKRHGTPTGGRALNGTSAIFLDQALSYQGEACLMWPYSTGSNGYANTCVDGKTVNLPRYICEKVHGPAPTPAHETAHSCGMGHMGCIAATHLRWATSVENKSDQLAHGTRLRGEESPHAKLTEDQAREILAIGRSQPQRRIAERFNVSVPTVSMIINGKSWGWLAAG